MIDWPGRALMQIHSSRLMFCHSALSAIKLAPVLKSAADNVAEAEIMLHFPCAFLHLHSCQRYSVNYFTFAASVGQRLISGKILSCSSAPGLHLYFQLVFPFFFHLARKVVLKSMLPKSFNHFLVIVWPQN